MALEPKVNVAVIAGGTGGYTTIRALKSALPWLNITHICGTWDNGGGSGKLLGSGLIEIPPGDVAQAILAASSWEEDYKAIYTHRDQSGQSLINLTLVSFQKQYGSFKEGIKQCSLHFNCRSAVVTATDNRTQLIAITPDGTQIMGEHNIDEYDGPIANLQLVAHDGDMVVANPDAVRAIEQADVIILGPGSQYTSVRPNSLVKELYQGIKHSSAPIIGIANLANDGHTLGWTACDYGRAFSDMSGRQISHLIANIEDVEDWLIQSYKDEDQDIVLLGEPQPEDTFRVITRELISDQDAARKPITTAGVKRSVLRHPPALLGYTLIETFQELGFNRPW